jgi:hypothetical protein
MNSTGELILTGLADGDKHGYWLTKDVAAFVVLIAANAGALGATATARVA